MGSCCCSPEIPCGNAEETSGLLKNDSKAAGPAGHTHGTGKCGPEADDDVKKTPDEANNTKVELMAEDVQVKRIPEVEKKEPNNTQENKPSHNTDLQTDTPSPRKGPEHKEKSTRAQGGEVKHSPAKNGRAEPLHCTLNCPQEEPTTAQCKDCTATNAAPEEVEQENQTHVQDNSPGSSPLKAKISLENNTETNTTIKHITSVDTTLDKDEDSGSKVTVDDASAEQTVEFSPNNAVLSVPNTQPPAAACQVPILSVVSQHNDKEPQSCTVTEDSESSLECKEAAAEDTKQSVVIVVVSESSPGSGPTTLDHSAEEQHPENSVAEPDATAPADASESSKPDQDAEPDLESAATTSVAVASSENVKQDIEKETIGKGEDKYGDVPKDDRREDAEDAVTEAETLHAREDAETQEETGKDEQLTESLSTDTKPDETETPVTDKEDSEDGLGNSEEDLYRGAEELSASHKHSPGSLSESDTTFLKVEDRCSLAPAMDILSYSEREWKGKTAKSALIRKGYKEMSQTFGGVRRVRGDNYCALRATLFQVLSHSTQLPSWLQDDHVAMLPEQLEAEEGLIGQWTFPGDCLQGDGTGDVALQLKGYMELLRNKWQAAVDCSSAVERQQLCERVFVGGVEELGLLEALKLLMLGRAVELHRCMQAGADVPLFCWLLFARDSSDCPRSFLSNHLRHVGLSAGLEQVEMFLLGYALQCTIQVYRLYQADTEEFVTFYPDDHKDDWPSVCLVTEDDRHYNVPVVEAAEHNKELYTS